MNSCLARTTLAMAFLILTVGAASPILATECNATGCFHATVTFMKVNGGKVWFGVEDNAQLENLVPADGCVVGNVFDANTGQHKALYVTAADPDRKEKISLLTVALATGQIVAFNPVIDPASAGSKCSLGALAIEAP